MAKVPLPPRRPPEMDGSDVSSPDTGDNFYPDSNIPVDPEYMKRLEKGYKTPEKKIPPVKKAEGGKIDFSKIVRNKKTGVLSIKKSTGGMVRGAGCAERGKGKGTVY
jgi:hypothetical protein